MLFRDYVSINRRRILRDVAGVYFGIALSVGAILGQAMIHSALDRITPSVTTAILLAITPAALALASHLIAAFIIGNRLARTAGLPMDEYVKSEAYQQQGKATLRVFWGRH